MNLFFYFRRANGAKLTTGYYFGVMTLEQLVIALIRLTGSLLVLRWALMGAVLAIIIDFSDLFWMGFLDLGGVPNYQAFDKWLDLIYMFAFFTVAMKWSGYDRSIAIVLFVFRMIGFAVFELTHIRFLLFLFPNVFEFWFLFVVARKHYRLQQVMTLKNICLVLLICLILKLGQEWILHGGKYLDRFTFFEALEGIYDFLVFWE